MDVFDISSLAISGEEIWLGTNYGLGQLKQGSSGYVFQLVNSISGNQQTHQVIENLLFDEEENLWIGTEEGLYVYDSAHESLPMIIESQDASNSLAINTAKILFLDSHGMLWYGTHGYGLYRINPLNRHVDNFRNNPADMRSLSQNAINCMYEDRSGVLWIGTFGAGISILDPQANKFELLCHNPLNPESLSSNFVWSVFEAADGTIWIGTNDKGLNAYSPETGIFRFYDHRAGDPLSLSASSVRRVYHDSKGNIWVGTDGGGLDLLNKATGHFSHFRHNPGNQNSLSNNSVRVIYEDDNGTLWIGTREGLNKMDIHNETFIHYLNNPDDPATLSDNIVFSVYEDSQGMLWVGTNNGLNRMDPSTGKFIRFGTAQGLPNEVIYGILPDRDNHIWMSTNFGICRMNLSDYSVTNFDVNDGLQSNEFNGGSFHLGRSGRHYWGGVYGLNIIEPEKIEAAKNESNVVLTKLIVLGKAVNVKSPMFDRVKKAAVNKILAGGDELFMGKNIAYQPEIILNYKQRFIGFEFNALNHAPSQKMSYSYRMENMEEEWIHSGDRNFVNYANMKPGTYVFRANATNKDGILSPNPVGLIITIKPPFWNTWWFIVLETLAIMALIVFIYIYLLKARTNKLLAAQNQEIYAANQQLKESQRQLSELNATKDKFFSIIAHDLKSPFTSLLSISEMMSKDYNTLDEEDKISSMTGFHRSARRIYVLLENLLTWSRSQTGRVDYNPVDFNITSLAAETIKLFHLPAEKKGISIQLTVKDDTFAHGDPGMISTVIRNLLDNAVKFSHNGGTVVLDIKPEDVLIRVAVKDEGVGIPEHELKGLFNLASQSISKGTDGERGTGLGLIICKEFVEKNGGRLLVKSEPSKGSVFSFYLQAGISKTHHRDISEYL